MKKNAFIKLPDDDKDDELWYIYYSKKNEILQMVFWNEKDARENFHELKEILKRHRILYHRGQIKEKWGKDKLILEKCAYTAKNKI